MDGNGNGSSPAEAPPAGLPGAAGLPRALRWRVHPAAQEPGRALLLLSVIGVAGLLAARSSGSPALGVLGALALLLSLRAWFLPRHYALDAGGAAESGPLCAGRQLPWSRVRTVMRSRFGVHLGTRHTDSRMLADRGLFLRTAGNADAVLAFVEGARRTS
jgi:hypothetical protein